MDRKALTRQADIIPLEALDNRINIIGAGAIGSFVSLALAKMGYIDQIVWDDDKIDIVNMNCQFYRTSDIGKPKVYALQNLIKDFTGENISVVNHRFSKEENGILNVNGIIISAVDSMEARTEIYRYVKEFPRVKMLIDPRMGAESALCYSINPQDKADCATYEKTLYKDANAVVERCTAKSTMYCTLAIAAHVAKVIKDYTCNLSYSRVMEWSIKDNIQKCYPSKR